MFLQKQQWQCTKRKERLRLRERRDTDLSNGTGPSFKLLQMAENDGFEFGGSYGSVRWPYRQHIFKCTGFPGSMNNHLQLYSKNTYVYY